MKSAECFEFTSDPISASCALFFLATSRVKFESSTNLPICFLLCSSLVNSIHPVHYSSFINKNLWLSSGFRVASLGILVKIPKDQDFAELWFWRWRVDEIFILSSDWVDTHTRSWNSGIGLQFLLDDNLVAVDKMWVWIIILPTVIYRSTFGFYGNLEKGNLNTRVVENFSTFFPWSAQPTNVCPYLPHSSPIVFLHLSTKRYI